jgi:ABC-type Zn2+ transport system substrate-binding protein/surface adhesin
MALWLNTKSDAKNAALQEKLTEKIERVRDELTGKIERVRDELTGKIERVENAVAEIKNNDLAHLNYAFKALTFILKQKGALTPEEQEHIDKSLEG